MRLPAPLLIAAATLWLPAHAQAQTIRNVVEAGIVCSGKVPERIGPRFYRMARKACRGRGSCRVRALNIAAEARLKAWGCTHFFVVAQCAGRNKEITSKGLTETLQVGC